MPLTTDPPAAAQRVVALLRRVRLDLSSEKRLQAQIAQQLQHAGIAFEREKALSAQDRPDFLLADGTLIECKLRGRARKIDVFRQLERYAAYPQVSALILASNLSMGLPDTCAGKPLYAASLSAGWL